MVERDRPVVCSTSGRLRILVFIDRASARVPKPFAELFVLREKEAGLGESHFHPTSVTLGDSNRLG